MLKFYTTAMMGTFMMVPSLMAMNDADIDALLSDKPVPTASATSPAAPVASSDDVAASTGDGDTDDDDDIDVEDDGSLDGDSSDSKSNDVPPPQHGVQPSGQSEAARSSNVPSNASAPSNGQGSLPQSPHGTAHGDDATWNTNVKAFGDQTIHKRIAHLQKVVTKQSANKTSTLTADGTQKKITDLMTQMNTEKDPKKIKKIKVKINLLQFQLAVLTGNCPPEFHLKTGVQDAKAPATYNEKAWKKLVAFVQKYDLKKFIQKSLKMTPEAKYLMQSVWDGHYPDALKPKKQSSIQGESEHPSSESSHHSAGSGHGSGHGSSTHSTANNSASVAH